MQPRRRPTAPPRPVVAVKPNVTPKLISLLERGDRTEALTLIKSGTDVRAADADGTTALHWAAHSGDVEVTKALIAAGADVKATNTYGATPMACRRRNRLRGSAGSAAESRRRRRIPES